MKNIISFLAIVISLSASAQDSTNEKQYKINLTESQINTLYQTLETSRNAVMTSTLPMNEGVPVLKNIDSLQSFLRKEYQSQSQSDSTKTK